MAIYPKIWGKGALLCYSGLDGTTTPGDDLVGWLCGDRVAVDFEDHRATLALFWRGVRDFSYTMVASDTITGLVNGKEFSMIFSAQTEIIGSVPTEFATPAMQFDPTVPVDENGVGRIGNRYFAFAFCPECGRYALYVSTEGAEAAMSGARAALKNPLGLEEKRAFFDRLPTPEGMSAEDAELLSKCYSIMKSQVYTTCGERKTRWWTTPDRLPHRHMWLWDSVFHSMGNVAISHELAADTLRAMLQSQDEDGFIAHMVMREGHSDVTQPPVLAWGVLNYIQKTGDTSVLPEFYPALRRFMDWIIANRDSNHNHLYEWYVHRDSVNCRCGESGMDNSPRFDGVAEMDCIDFSCYMAHEARCMSILAQKLGNTADVARFDELYSNIRRAVNETLWSEEDGMYFDYDIERGKLHRVWAVSSFLPLFAGICPPDRAKRLISHMTDPKRFWTEKPLPSIALDDPTFGDDMWRGPVWINMNYMVMLGLREYGYTELATMLRRQTLDLVSHWYQNDGVLYEFYDSHDQLTPTRMNRKGPAIIPPQQNVRMPAISDYGWTATLTAAILLEGLN